MTGATAYNPYVKITIEISMFEYCGGEVPSNNNETVNAYCRVGTPRI
jgi:hypothetical protein